MYTCCATIKNLRGSFLLTFLLGCDVLLLPFRRQDPDAFTYSSIVLCLILLMSFLERLQQQAKLQKLATS